MLSKIFIFVFRSVVLVYDTFAMHMLYEQQRFVLEKSSVTNLQARYARVYPQEFYAPFLNSSQSLPVLGEDKETTSSSKINTSSQIAAQLRENKFSSAKPRPPSPPATWWKEVYCSRACFAVVRDYLRTMGGGSSSSGAAGGGAGASNANPPTRNFPEKEQQECYEWCRKGLQHFEKAVGADHLRIVGVNDFPGNYRHGGGVGRRRGPYKTDVDRFTVLFGSCLDLTAGAGRAAAVRYGSAQEQVEDEVKQQQQEEPQHLSLSPQEPEGQHVVGLQIEMLTTLVACLHRAVAALPQVAGGSSGGHQHTSTEQPRKSFPTGQNSSKYMLEYEALPGGRQFGHDVPDTELQRVMLEQPFRAVCRLTQATVFGLQQVVNQVQELSPFSSTSNAELNDENMLAMAIYAISSLEAAERVASFLQSLVVLSKKKTPSQSHLGGFASEISLAWQIFLVMQKPKGKSPITLYCDAFLRMTEIFVIAKMRKSDCDGVFFLNMCRASTTISLAPCTECGTRAIPSMCYSHSSENSRTF